MTANVYQLFPVEGDAEPKSPTKAQTEILKAEFEVWYKPFPRKVSRAHAFIAFVRARKKAELAELIAGRDRYIVECVGKEEQFICHPATWLNGERWLDEVSAKPPMSDQQYARMRVWKTKRIWLPQWGMEPGD